MRSAEHFHLGKALISVMVPPRDPNDEDEDQDDDEADEVASRRLSGNQTKTDKVRWVIQTVAAGHSAVTQPSLI